MTTEVVLDDNREVVLTNATVTASGSASVTSYGGKEVILVINVSGTVTGTTPTLTFTIQELDPGDEATSIGVSVSGAAITATGTQIIEIPVSRSSFFKVSWVVTGTTPVFNAVYATIINKGAGASVLYDNLGNSVFGTAGTPGTAVLTVQGVSGGQASPVSGTVTSNQGTPNTTANSWPTTVTDGTHGPAAVKAASTAVAAADPSLAVGLSPNSPLPAGTNAIGSVTATQATAANLNATVVQGAGSGAAGTYWYVRVTDGTHTMPTMDAIARAGFQEITDGTNGPVAVKAASTAAVAADPSFVVALSPNSPIPTGSNVIGAVTQSGGPWSVSGTVTSNQGTANTLANAWPEKITDGTNGPAAVKPASTAAVAADPALVVAISPNNSFSVTNQDVTSSGALGALNAAVSVTHPGLQSVGMQLAAGTLIGTIVAEASFDGGTTWNQTYFDSPSTGAIVSSLVFGSANTATAETIVGVGGAGMTRVRVSAYTSGTANATVRASDINDPSTLYAGVAGSTAPPTVAQVGGTDGTNLRALLTDGSGRLTVIGQGVAGTPAGGLVSVQGVSGGTNLPVSQATAANLNATVVQGAGSGAAGTFWYVRVTDGTNTMPTMDTAGRAGFQHITDGTNTAAVKAASTAAVAADPSLVTAFSPNSPLPTGSNVIGAVTQSAGPWSVSGTVTANQGTANTVANSWPTEITDGTHGPAAVKAASTAAAAADPSLVVALSPNSPVPAGTNAIGSVTATQTTAANLNATAAQGAPNTVANSWPTEITDGTHGPAAVKAASTAAVAADPSLVVTLSPNSPTPGIADITATGALGALNAAVTITTAGTQSVGFQLASGTLVGTIVAEVSFDGGTTWNATYFDQNNKLASIVFGASNTAQAGTLVGEGGAGEFRVRVSAFTSGTANITLRASQINDPSVDYGGLVNATVQPPTAAQIAGWDGTTFRVPTVKAASTAIAAGDQPLAVGLHPSSPLPSGTNSIGTVNQGTAASVANSWTTEITDGTHGPAAVKAASTAAAAADPSLVVALSPNSPVPAGTNVIGALTANQSVNLAQVGGTTTVTGGEAGALGVGGLAAAGAATVGNPVLVAGSDGTDARSLLTDTSGRQVVVGAAAAGAAVAGNPVLVAGSDGTDARTLSTDASGHAIIVGDGVAGTPAGGVVSIQGVSGGQPVVDNLTQIAGNAVSTAASGVLKVGVVGNAGATLDGTLAAGTAPTDGLGTLAQYNTTQPAPTNAQTLSLQSDQSGNLLEFPGVQTKSGAAWTSATTINTLQFPTGTTTVGAPIGASAILVQLDQTTTITGGAVTFQGTYDGTNWVTIPANQVLNPQNFAQLTNPYTFVASTNQPFLLLVQGFQQIRLNLTTVITGTGSVTPFWTLLAVSPAGATNAVQGLAPAGSAPVGSPLPMGVVAPSGNMENVVGGSDGEVGVALMGNDFSVQSNSTITASGSTTITKSFYGVQQINLIVNVTAAPTGTTPTITYTIQELDPGNGTTTMGNSTSTSAISAAGVYTASLATSTSSSVKVSWTVTGTTPSFTGVYATVVSKATPATQTTTTTSTTATPGISPGYITTSAKTNVALQASTYNEQSANFTGSVSSASANDSSAGTGARTITITWMNAAGTTTGTETATMNGTTAVNLVTTTKCFIEKNQVASVGSTGSNVGAITLFTGSAGAGTAVAIINATDNQTYLGHHYVVSGKTCHVTDMTGNTNSSNQSAFTLQAVSIPVANVPSLQVSDWVVGSQTFQIQRTFSSQILMVGPARIQMFVAPGATASIESFGSFDYFDQ